MNGIQRIERSFSKGKLFIAYLTAGDGGIKRTLDASLALIEAGIHMLEIGIPFSDPIADGPIIQRAASRALASQTTLQDVLWLTTEIRKKSDIPLILFTYLNPILSAMEGSFFKDAQKAGVDGLLIVDCPIEESSLFRDQCLENEIAPIFVISPSTSAERIRHIDQYGKGFLYYACQKGTTGVRAHLPIDFVEKMQFLRQHARLPVVVGFGISNRESAVNVLKEADGVVVGSLFVKALEEGMAPLELKNLVKSLIA